MEISTQHSGTFVDMTVRGRLDAYWSNSLASALDELVRNGHHSIRLNLAGVGYMSSAGIRVLLKFYKQLQRINGALVVSNPSEAVKSVLELAGLQVLLQPGAEAPTGASRPARRVEIDGIDFEVYDRQPAATLTCRALGDPRRLAAGSFEAAHCRTLNCTASTFAVGLGAFGSGFDDCRPRFGEFLAAAGAATYLPTDGSNVPDYVVAAAALVPELRVLYAVACEGEFAHLARFEHPLERAGVSLTQLAQASLSLTRAESVGMVLVTESAGLVGASLRRSPALAPNDGGFFDHPGVRNRLSYSPERAHTRSLAVVVGVATRSPAPQLESFVRPLGAGSTLHGHFHAAAFSYHPLQKGEIELQPMMAALFETETLQGLMHLIGDDREIAGTGESEFLRGGLWIGPIAEVATE